MLADLGERFQDAVQAFWDARARQQQKQIEAGKIDAGTRRRTCPRLHQRTPIAVTHRTRKPAVTGSASGGGSRLRRSGQLCPRAWGL